MKRNIPNWLTMGRLAISMALFALLADCDLAQGPDVGILLASVVIYIVAGLTDVLDGHLARKWDCTSAFGRIADPFVDKVIVCGTFVLLTGRNFAFPGGEPAGEFERSLPAFLHGGMASAVQSWMVVVLIAREFIVSGIRGYSESQGLQFPATSAGKNKMLVQSVTICMVLLQMAVLGDVVWAVVAKITLVWLTVIVTVLSGLAYVGRARKLLMEARREQG